MMIGDKEYTDEFLELVKYELQQDLLRNYTPCELRVFERAYNISSLNPIPKIAEKNIELTKQHIVVATMVGKRKRSSSQQDSSSPQQSQIRYATLAPNGEGLMIIEDDNKTLDDLYYWRDGNLRKYVKQYTKESIILFDKDAVNKIKENNNVATDSDDIIDRLWLNPMLGVRKIYNAPHVKYHVLPQQELIMAYYAAFQLPEISLYMLFDENEQDVTYFSATLSWWLTEIVKKHKIDTTTQPQDVMSIIQRLFVETDKKWFSIEKRRKSSRGEAPISFAGVLVTPSHIYLINLGVSTVLLKSDGIKEILNTLSHEIHDDTKKHMVSNANSDEQGMLNVSLPITEHNRFLSIMDTFNIPDDHIKVANVNTLSLKIKNVEFSINRTRGFGGDFRLKSTDGVNYSDNPIISAKPDVYSFKRSFTDRILIGNKLLFDNFKPRLLEILNDNKKLDLPDTWQGINGNNGERCIAIELHTSCPGILKNKPPSGELSFDTA